MLLSYYDDYVPLTVFVKAGIPYEISQRRSSREQCVIYVKDFCNFKFW